jgi:S1-C subfamily serine protease
LRSRRWFLAGVIVTGVVGIVILVSGVSFLVLQNGSRPEGSADAALPFVGLTSSSNPVAPVEGDETLFGPPSSYPELIAKVKASTVVIDCPLGQGSGFVLDVSTLTGQDVPVIVTNQHVVEGCEGQNQLTITAQSGTFAGTSVATDKDFDLAIIEVPGMNLPALKLAEGSQVGEWAMAFGAPLGISDTASFGYITNVKPDEYLITTDAVLGPGNSGGPLVNNRGEVLGVNSAVFVEANGIGIAMPPEGLCVSLLTCR